jgi:Beta-propeller repeat
MHALAPRPTLDHLRSLTLAALVAAAAAAAVLTGAYAGSGASSRAPAQTSSKYGQVPLTFAPNRGQADPQTLYQAGGNGIDVAFGRHGVALALGGGAAASSLPAPMLGQTGAGALTDLAGDRTSRLELAFRGANPQPTVEASQRQTGKVSYLLGRDESKWRRDLPTYSQLSYAGLWQGVDMRFRGEPGNLKYEFSVAPGADPSRIALSYAGASSLSVAADGALQVGTGRGTLRDSAPVAYQRIGGRRVPVTARYRLDGATGYGFTLGAYDHARPLVVDPGLEYSTYLGGNEADQAADVAVDASGSAYVVGYTGSTDFPTTPGAYSAGSGSNVFVTKMKPDGTGLDYSAYIGGTGIDYGFGVDVDGQGQAYVTGYTDSSGYPTTAGALSTTRKGNSDDFVTKLNAAGTGLVYSTYLGGNGDEMGNDQAAIAVDSSGAAYVGGGTRSTDLATPGAADTTYTPSAKNINDAFVAKLNAAGSQLSYATYLGGDQSEETLYALAIGADGSAYATGLTNSSDFPTTAGAYDTTLADSSGDAYVTKVNPAGSAYTYSTLLGSDSSDIGEGIAVDGSGSAYVGGATYGTNYPTTAGAYDTARGTGVAGFVTKLNAAGSGLAYSTYLEAASGNNPTFVMDIDLGPGGTAYVTGNTAAANYPTTAGAYDTTANGDNDGFFTKLTAAGDALTYSTYLGGGSGDFPEGVAVDLGGKAYLAGWTYSGAPTPFPTTTGAYDTTKNNLGGPSNSYDSFVAKLDPGVLPQCSNGVDDDGDGAVDYPADPGCASASDDTEYTAPPGAAGAAAAQGAKPVVPSAAPPSGVSCGRRVISLVRADKQGGKVKVSGLVGTGLFGKSVTVSGNYKLKGKTVKTTVKADRKGRFTATLTGPPARKFSRARYRAASGSAKSIELKLFQAMATSSIRQKSGRITISGSIRKSLLGKRNPVLIRRLLCGKYRTVASVKPGADGRYSVSFVAPREAGAALYRAESTLLVRRGSHRYAPAYARAVSITLTGSTG